MSNGNEDVLDVDADYERRVAAPARAAVRETLPGGTPYAGVIVPDAAALQPGQIHEREFLKRLAEEFISRLPNAPGHGEDREIAVNATMAMFEYVRDRFATHQTLEEFLRERFDIAASLSDPDAWINAILGRLDRRWLDGLAQVVERVARIAEQEEGQLRGGEYQPNEEDQREIQAAAASVAPVLVQLGNMAADVANCVVGAAPCDALAGVTIAGAVASSRSLGQLVHLLIQEHYLLTHPGHQVMMESFIRWPGGQSSVYRLGKLGGTALGNLYATVRYALGTIRQRTKLPDIMDLDTREVYEIKPRSQVEEGIIQLCRNYIVPFNGVARLTGHRPLRAGRDWRASPAYWVPVLAPPGGLVALTVQCPGLIIYDLIPFVPPEKQPHLVRVPARQRAPVVHFEITPATAFLIVLAVVGVLALFVLAPYLAGTLAAVGTQAALVFAL